MDKTRFMLIRFVLPLDERGWKDRPVPEADCEVGVLPAEPPLQAIQ